MTKRLSKQFTIRIQKYKNLLQVFDPEGVTLKGGEEPQQPAQGDDTVDQMAQSATANAMQ